MEGTFHGDLFQTSPVMYASGARPWSEPKHDRVHRRRGGLQGLVVAPPFGGCLGRGMKYAEVITIYSRR